MTTSPENVAIDHDVYNPLCISRITVENLFGQYSYDLYSNDTDLSKLIILYGDNGSGKTTILKSVFHLLSPATDKRHRGELATVPFSRLSVVLGDGTTVTATRAQGELVGSFSMSIRGPSWDASADFATDQNFKLVKPKKDARKALLDGLKMLNLKLHFLSDDRKIVTDLISTDEGDEEDAVQPSFLASRGFRFSGGTIVGRTGMESSSSLEKAIQRLVDWIRKKAITGSGTGEVSANTLYADITRRIVSPVEAEGTREKPDLNDLMDQLRYQALRSVSFAQFGLSTEIPADDLISVLQNPRAQQHAELLVQILRPFINGVGLRLDALQSIFDTINAFVGVVNAFYQGKVLDFDLREGVTIGTDTGEVLSPNLLSSGEKQLLLLLCNVLAAGDQASVFIIDEPELSLNVKWQRKLVDALLELTKNSRTQFILATHSFELLTQHQHNVLQLTSSAHA